jgi:hypothetical protein
MTADAPADPPVPTDAEGDLPDALRPFAFLLGTWRGEGVGGYPTLEEDFRYGEEVHFGLTGKPILSFRSRSWSLDDGRPLAAQDGFWRPTSPTDVEVVLCVASGLVEVFYGELVEGPSGPHVDLRSDLIGHTATAKQVAADRRMYAVRGGRLMYAMDMATATTELAPHLSAALERVSE